MCASARNMMLRSTDHVCKFKESHHPHPTPPHPTLRRWPDVIADKSKNTLKHHGHLRSVVQLHNTWQYALLRLYQVWPPRRPKDYYFSFCWGMNEVHLWKINGWNPKMEAWFRWFSFATWYFFSVPAVNNFFRVIYKREWGHNSSPQELEFLRRVSWDIF